MPKRGENIRKRKDGRWEARYIKGYREDGTALYGSLYAKSYAQAKEKKAAVTAQSCIPNRSGVRAPVVFDSVITEWLSCQRFSVKESTYAHYRRLVNTHIRPDLGGIKLRQFTQQALVQYVDRKLTAGRLDGKGGLSVKTVRDLLTIIRQIIAFAVEKGYMGHVTVKNPKKKNAEIQILTRQEQERLESYLKGEPDSCRFGVYLCLYTGLRIGEVCALRWSDIHFDSMLLSVRRTIHRVEETDPLAGRKTKIIIDTPKTESSLRDIPLPAFLLELLREYAGRALPGDYLLTGDSRCLEPRSYYNRYKGYLRESGIGDYTFHALRHTFATRCIENGFDAKSLSEILGHANVNITLQRYVHSSLELKRVHMDRLAALFLSGSKLVSAVPALPAG